MHPPTVPTVVVSSPQDDDPKPNGPLRQPIVSQSGSPRLNFSRPGRPPILSSEEQKRQVLERNARRANSPRTSPSPASLSPVTPVTGIYPDKLHTPGRLSPSELRGTTASSSYLHSDGVYSSPSLASPSHVLLPSHPPSLRAGSSFSLYSNSYSFYQLDSALPSPTSQSPRSSPDISPTASRPVPAEPQTPEEYLQLGIQYHEANQLKDSAVCFEKSAKEQGGCGVGMLMWGLTLRHGWGCEKNEKSGFKWLTKAAESAVQDLEKAKKGLEVKGVKVGCPFFEELVLAIYEVGQCFFQGWGVAKDQKMAVSYYRVAAKLGDADAQQDLAFCLANGRGCKKDKKEAAKWYRAAVAQGVSDVGMAWIYKDKYKD
ncbi:HCP-like protein [Imleria badia]|nr:HCP-like protein [Imleria badia]